MCYFSSIYSSGVELVAPNSFKISSNSFSLKLAKKSLQALSPF